MAIGREYNLNDVIGKFGILYLNLEHIYVTGRFYLLTGNKTFTGGE